ncbi:MAG: DUF5320 domain-containing protein [Proteobacteria bacterium]|nr:DUF5320 domain-containing protein [Pseudomonadota bacterium]
MPRGDGTGPAGMGPMTGRAAGYCAGFRTPGSMNFAPGWGYRGWGRGRGGGRGFRNQFYATGLTGWQRAAGGRQAWGNPFAPGMPYGAPTASAMNREQELGALKDQAGYLEETLGNLRKRIEELETTK